jgi:hypothetical protein
MSKHIKITKIPIFEQDAIIHPFLDLARATIYHYNCQGRSQTLDRITKLPFYSD